MLKPAKQILIINSKPTKIDAAGLIYTYPVLFTNGSTGEAKVYADQRPDFIGTKTND